METAEIIDLAIKIATPATIAWVATVVKPMGELKTKVAEFAIHLPVLSGAILKLEKSIDHQATITPLLVADIAVLKEQVQNLQRRLDQ
jgi:hypothetical protein